MADWYYAKNDQQCGPVTREKLAQLIAAGQVGEDDLVWNDAMADWAPAKEAPGLLSAKPAPARPTPARPAAAKKAVPAAAELADAEIEEEPTGFWSKLPSGAKIGILAGGGCLLATLMLTVVYLAMFRNGGQESEAVEQVKPAAIGKPAAKKPTPPTEPVRKVIAFDPKSIPPACQADYDRGLKQGDSIARRLAESMKGTNMDKDAKLFKVKEAIQERNDAVQAAVHAYGEKDSLTIETFGRREGFKASLEKYQLPQPPN